MTIVDPDPSVSASSDAPTPGAQPLIQKVAISVLNLVLTSGATTMLGAVTTIAITRLLGPTGYGVYGSAVAVSVVLGASADFGFQTVLARDMAESPVGQRTLLRAAHEVATVWSAILAAVMIVMALAAGLSTQRGLAILILAPSMVFNGLNPSRVIFIVNYQTFRLARISVICLLLQTCATITLAAAHLGPAAVTVSLSVGNMVSSVWVAVSAHGIATPADGTFGRRELIRRSLPLGLIAIMTRVYLSIDLVILGWYVTGPRLGDYAAASRFLTVLAGLAGTVMSGALPALSSQSALLDGLNHIVQRVWHWLLISALPTFLALALFSPLFVNVVLGRHYEGAIALTRILCIAGGVTVVSNVVGAIMIAKRRSRQLVQQNLFAIVVNVGGNFMLIPRYGVYASAWLTSVTEIVVCSASIFSLRGDLAYRQLWQVSWRPAVALALGLGCALALLSLSERGALVASTFVFVAALFILRAWPEELRIRYRAPAPAGGRTPA